MQELATLIVAARTELHGARNSQPLGRKLLVTSCLAQTTTCTSCLRFESDFVCGNREFRLGAIFPLADICNLSYISRAHRKLTASSFPPALRKKNKGTRTTQLKEEEPSEFTNSPISTNALDIIDPDVLPLEQLVTLCVFEWLHSTGRNRSFNNSLPAVFRVKPEGVTQRAKLWQLSDNPYNRCRHRAGPGTSQ